MNGIVQKKKVLNTVALVVFHVDKIYLKIQDFLLLNKVLFYCSKHLSNMASFVC